MVPDNNTVFPVLISSPAQNLQSGNNVALMDGAQKITYSDLVRAISQLASGLLGSKKDLKEERIAFMFHASTGYVSCLFGIWHAGGIAVPLNVGAAVPEQLHALENARVSRIITDEAYLARARELADNLDLEVLTLAQVLTTEERLLPELRPERRAMILFTSGTTNKPKGVVSSHKNIRAQVTTLIEAWGWQETDSIPLFLPLHHVHGIINVLCCGLWIGASVHLFAGFNPNKILHGVANNQFSVFMAVPTVYIKIMSHLQGLDKAEQDLICAGFRAMRLNVSGSAACPVTVYEQWLKLTGQVLLERYGMTEIGMAISNPYTGERRAGAVGLPLPGVEVILVDDDERVIVEEDAPGEIRIKGDNVFLEYWDNPAATAESFQDGWFCTGDMAVLEQGYYRILGRSSIDIIKSGGFKISALEIEGVLLNHEAVAECAVVGIEDDTWGELVKVFLVLVPGVKFDEKQFIDWCKERLSSYKIPRSIACLKALPRNAMGKVTKPALKNT